MVPLIFRIYKLYEQVAKENVQTIEKREGGTNMCEMLDQLIKKGEARGEAKGEAEGKAV